MNPSMDSGAVGKWCFGRYISRPDHASPEAFKYAGGFERLNERSELRGIGPESE